MTSGTPSAKPPMPPLRGAGEENDVDYYQAGKAPANPSEMENLLKDFFSDEDNVDEDENESVTPEQAAKLCELIKQLHDIRSQLGDLYEEEDGEAASEAIADAASSVDDAMDSLEEIIEGEINVNIVVDRKTSTAGIIKLTELLKKMADRGSGDESDK